MNSIFWRYKDALSYSKQVTTNRFHMTPSNFDSVFEEVKQFTLSKEDLAYLKEIAKWARFLAIVGFIFIGFGILIAFFLGAFINQIPSLAGSGLDASFVSGMYSGYIIVLAMIYLAPCIYLYQFGARTLNAFKREDQAMLTNGFRALKHHYKFIGILMIICLASYGLIMVLGVIGGLFMTFSA